MTNTVSLTIDAGIAVVTLNRPDQLNALNGETRRGLHQALVQAEEARAVILTGAGRGFCVGQDLSAAEELADCHDCVANTYNPLVAQLIGMQVPVIAAVNGPAVGAGMGIALGCDMVLMSESSFLSCAFGKVGLVPDSGATYYLARQLGHQRAFEIAVSGRRILPDEAVALGLANRMVSPGSLLEEAHAAARSMAECSPKALALTKQLLREAAAVPLAEALVKEALAQGVCGNTPEHVSSREKFVKRG